MSALMIMLGIAIFPTTNFRWAVALFLPNGCKDTSSCQALDTPVSAKWRHTAEQNLEGNLSPQGVLSYIIMIASHLWQARALSPATYRFSHQILRKPVDGLRDTIRSRKEQVRKPKSYFFLNALVGIHILLFAIFDFSGSFCLFLWVVANTLGCGTFQLLYPRTQVIPDCVVEALNEWGFRQILPMLLLLTPLYGIVEHFIGKQFPLTVRPYNAHAPKALQKDSDPENADEETGNPGLHNGGTRRRPNEDRLDPSDLHRKIYSTVLFRFIAAFLPLVVVGVSVGFFVITALAFHDTATGQRKLGQTPFWWENDWRFLPVFVAGGSAAVLILLIAILCPVLESERKLLQDASWD
ncbi:hypothetical protein MMC25_002423 [Agyrium rufum]|nr:hypothetical protein [Agyrium rufum]